MMYIALILLFLTPALQIAWSAKSVEAGSKTRLRTITMASFLLGILLPIAATFVFLYSIPPDVKCITGIEIVPIIGWGITVLSNPIIALGFYSHRRKKQHALLIR